jgi:hypothetical protein
MKNIFILIPTAFLLSLTYGWLSHAKDIQYDGSEQKIYVTPGEPTQVVFPSKVQGGIKNKDSRIAIEKNDNYLIIFAKPGLSLDGEGIIIQIDDKRTYSLRIMPSDDSNPRDSNISVVDLRPPMMVEEEEVIKGKPSQLTEFMRNLILVAEFGKKKGIAGYRRSNQYSGETIMYDGTVKATLDEVFIGTNLWGYVVSVENLLDTTQKINPASFRLDGTRAITAQRWELAPKPQTAEQERAGAHKGKIYIITRSKRG